MGNIGTGEEIATLYRRHVGMVYQLCLMLLKNVPDAEDVTQTVFRKVIEYGKPFRDPEHEKAWLIVTARNECKNQLKHWWRRNRASEDAWEHLTWEQPEDGALWEYILSLPEKYRMVLYLHYYQGYTALETKEAKPMHRMKKMTAVMAAAALLLMACAFTVATGLDQRILAYFGGTQEDAQLLAPGFMAVDLTSIAENGETVHISQVYSDHRSVAIVGELTVSDGSVLNQDAYRFDDWHLRPKGIDGNEPEGGYGGYGTYGGAEIWTDDDPDDNALSFLLVYHYTASNFDSDSAELTWANEIQCFELTLGNLKGCAEGEAWSSAPVLAPGEWTFTIPLSGKDFGWTLKPEQTIQLAEETVTVEEIYLSPVGLSVRLANESGTLTSLMKNWEDQENSGNPWGSSVILHDQNGRTIEGSMPYSKYSPYTGEMLLTFDEIYDPAQFQGGTVMIMGQSFSLDDLQPVAD